MPTATSKHASGKRKPDTNVSKDTHLTKRPRNNDPKTPTPALLAPHESIIADLNSKYDILPASVISSTKIKKRIMQVTDHIMTQGDRPRVVLLYARTADVCKLITVVETCKRIVSEEGKAYYQYNQLFDQPERSKSNEIIEETILEKNIQEDNDSDNDDFEVMHSRFEDAVLPQPSPRSVKSMRAFISTVPIQELKIKKGVTVQSGTAK
ncbi:DNA RNA-binding Alba [Fusarium pseudocircinatum]|uniref:DNA RNA-binding Alba n=1 Tax=Fusarium pseudocircinatum TaxID=56676 RepID=A0A8H5PBU3_9HYPO|nr:DNA RNA-binding Alba [Fusarium pseudocircinatum]